MNHKHYLLYRLWPLWEQQYSEITGHRFVMKKIQFKNKDEILEEFYLINKPKCLSSIKQYWKEFKSHFENFNSPEDLLEAICENGPHIIKNHKLLGLLLGYGEHNTHLFQQREFIFEQLASLIYLQNKEILSNIPYREFINLIDARKQMILFPNTSWQLLWQEYQNINIQISSSLTHLIPYRELLAIPLVICKVDAAHPETQKILKNNLKTQKILKSIYYHPQFLQIILRKLKD